MRTCAPISAHLDWKMLKPRYKAGTRSKCFLFRFSWFECVIRCNFSVNITERHFCSICFLHCHMHHIANVSGHVLYDSCEHNKYNASWDLQFNSIYSQIDKMKTIIKPYQIEKNKMLLFHSSNSYYIYQFNCSFRYIYTA